MKAQEYLDSHGISDLSVEKFGLTFDAKKITIPVKDEEGNFLYNKYRHLDFDKDNPDSKKYSFDADSKSTIFNSEVIATAEWIIICEGEFDCIKLDQEGFNAVTNTSGAMTFKDEWVELFENKKLIILYDNDETGQKATKKLMDLFPLAIPATLPGGIKDVCDYFQEHTEKEFSTLISSIIKANSVTYKQLCDVVDKWLLLPDKNVLKILLATMVAHQFSSDPLWMFLVAPPSGTKTELISTLSSIPLVHQLSDLTPQTFASGMKAKVDPSLLLQLKNNILIMKDFTTVLSMRFEDRQIILSQLREIYDGKYSKAFGTGKVVEWEGRLSLIAGVTPIIDTHSAVFQMMGERFVMYRVPQPDEFAVAKKALTNYGHEKEMRSELKTTMRKYFSSIEIPQITDIEISEEIIDALARLASFVVVARSGVIKDAYTKDIQYIPSPEAPSRFAKQIGVLVKALAVVDGRKKVTWNDYYLTMRVALDAIPRNRMTHLIAIASMPYGNTLEISNATRFSKSGTENVLQDLVALNVIDVKIGGNGLPNQWSVSEWMRRAMGEFLPVKDDDKIYDIFPQDDEYFPFIKRILLTTPYVEKIIIDDDIVIPTSS